MRIAPLSILRAQNADKMHVTTLLKVTTVMNTPLVIITHVLASPANQERRILAENQGHAVVIPTSQLTVTEVDHKLQQITLHVLTIDLPFLQLHPITITLRYLFY